MELTTDEVAAAVAGEVFGRATVVRGAGIDSRTVGGGELFVPLVAERDGHDFIGAALAAGAGAYLTSGPIEAGTGVRVDDTAIALARLGAFARSRLPDRVVGITGSVGKTSVKDLLRVVGGTTWRTHAAVGSFNNELGVPLTLVNAPDGTELTVVEMGARGMGHIAELCAVARPTVGIVTVVAGAHLERFGDLDTVARAKGELVEALPDDGIAVLNADDERVVAMASRTAATVVTFGVRAGDVRAEGLALDDDLRARFWLRSPWGDVEVHLGVAGEHQVTNALGAATAALALGVDPAAVAQGLAGARLSAMRMDLQTLPSGARLLDDAYNANPTSTVAALRSLAALPARRRVAALGTMAELGAGSDSAHQEVAAAAAELEVQVLAVAEPAYGQGAVHVADCDEALAWLRQDDLDDQTAVLVKGSRSAGLERLVAMLRAASA